MSDFKFWDKEGRQLETMERYTIGIDLATRLGVARKLKELGFDDPKFRKGTQAALVRVLLRMFADDRIWLDFTDTAKDIIKPDNVKDWKERLEAEYTYTATKNKRSNL